MTPAQDFTPAKSGNKYELLKELGRGGMGVVHLAVSRGPQGFRKLVVLKMMRQQLLGDIDSHRMFLEEARISARLSHPNIVHAYEVTEHDGIPTMVMEYLEGQPFSQVLFGADAGNPMPRSQRLLVLTKVLAGLGAAHEMRDYDGSPLNLVHRDASPHNVFVLYDGQVKVLDFGIAKAAGSEVETRAGVLKGKIRYMPPEQLLHLSQDRRADVFTVGVTLWEALAGRRFWADHNDGQVIADLLAKRLPALPADAEIPAELVEICQRALAPDPQNRYATAGELQRDLEQYLLRQPVPVSPDDVADYMRKRFLQENESAKFLIESHIRLERQQEQVVAHDSTRVVTPNTREPSAGSITPGPTTTDTGAGTATATATQRMRWPAFVALPAMVLLASMTLMVGIFTGGRHGAATQGAAPDPRAGKTTAGAATVTCMGGLKLCDVECVSVDRPDRGCGGDGCAACSVTNATARCNQTHRCDIAVCYRGFDDCDGNGDNGCETNVRTDPNNCGSCGSKCPLVPHGQRGCGDACTIWRCDVGFRDCNGALPDGCETSVMNSPANCGGCGQKCGIGQRCRQGVCG